MLGGFFFFILGLLGALQIGFYEGLSDFYGPAFVLLLISVLIFLYLVIKDKKKAAK